MKKKVIKTEDKKQDEVMKKIKKEDMKPEVYTEEV